MARLALQIGATVAGAVIGSVVPGLGTALGASLGSAIGGVAGSLIFPANQNPPPGIYSRQQTSSINGAPIPWGYGNHRIAGECIWQSSPFSVETVDPQGHKVWSFRQSLAVCFGEGPGLITRMWFDSKLVYSLLPSNYRGYWSSTPPTPYVPGDVVYDPEGVHYYLCILQVPIQFNGPPSQTSEFWDEIDANFDTSTGSILYKYTTTRVFGPTIPESLTFYPGDETQLPDPVIESYKGAGKVPAFRGLCYVLFENLVLFDFGNRIPNVRAEISYSPANAFPVRTYDLAGVIPERITIDEKNRVAFVLDTVNNAISRVNIATGLVEDQGVPDPRTAAQQSCDFIPAVSLQNAALAVDSTGYLWGSCTPVGEEPTKFLVKYGAFSFVAAANLVYPYDNYPEGLNCHTRLDGNNYVAAMSERTDGRFDVVVVRTSDAVQVGHAIIGDASTSYANTCRMPVFDDTDHAWFVLRITSSSNWQLWKVNLAGGVDGSGDYVSVSKYAFTAGAEGQGLGCVFNPADSTLVIPTLAGGFVVVDASGAITSTQTRATPMFDVSVPAAGIDACESIDGRLTDQYFRVPGDTDTMLSWDTASWPTLPTATLNISNWLGATGSWGGLQYYPFGDASWAWDPITFSFFVVAVGPQQPGIQQLLVGRLAGGPHSIKFIISDLWARTGRTIDDLDLTELNNARCDGYPVPNNLQVKQALTPLAQAFFFDMVESDGKLVVKTRPRNPVLSIPQDDLSLVSDKGPMTESIGQENDLPGTVEVQYMDPALNYQQGKQSKSRSLRTIHTRNRATITLPISIISQKARRIAEQWLYLYWLQRFPYDFSTRSAYYLVLDPSDVVTFINGGNTFQGRILGSSFGQDYTSKWSLVSENPNNYVSVIDEGTSDPGTTPGIPFTPATLLFLFDMPLLADTDSPAAGSVGFYVAMGSPSAGWNGALLFDSPDNVDFSHQLDATTVEPSFGFSRNALGAPASPWAWDYDNSLTISMPNNGTAAPPPSATQLATLNGSNQIIVGSEVLNYQTRIQNDDGTWTFTNLLRGRRGTEWACGTHQAGETVIFVNPGGVLRETVAASLIGQTRYYKAITNGTDLSSAAAQSLTLAGAQLKPYAPCHLAGSRDGSNNLTITWVRRDRIGSGYLSGPVPMSEASELYDVEIISGVGAVLRTISGLTSATASYTAAQQTTDGGTPGNPVNVKVYQRSSVASMPNSGRGYPGVAPV